MGSRYDSRTTTFSPEGRLYQVEYAMEAITQAGPTMGIVTSEGILLAGEKLATSDLLDTGDQHEKIFDVADHIIVAVAGHTADANVLLNKLRLVAARYELTYEEPIPVEKLVVSVCDLKQEYTQFGGLRPFGVAFLFAGWDAHRGLQLYHSDPSGNFSGWKAYALGQGHTTAMQALRSDYPEAGVDMAAGRKLLADVLRKTSEAGAKGSNLELAVLTREGVKRLSEAEVDEIMKEEAPVVGAAAPAA